jgi:glucans biosynthesis protein
MNPSRIASLGAIGFKGWINDLRHALNLTNGGALSRRAMLKSFAGAAAALCASTALTRNVFARQLAAAGQGFSFDHLTEEARALAARAYEPTPPLMPDFARRLTYDAYRLIQFRPDRAVELDDAGGYQVQAFHLGWLYNEPVRLHEVSGGDVQPIMFSTQDFEYRNAALDTARSEEALPGVAGFRINYPLNRPEHLDELVSFLGASYFRALGRDNVYGASARGAVVNSWREGDEEFPRFSAFYLERAEAGAPLVINAMLDGPSLAGAYRFEISPGNDNRQETLIDVTARLFFRADIAELGIAPLTSMFLYAEGNRSRFDDYRPQVHDSNGLLVLREGGEVAWRALNNPPSLANSYFVESNPRAFGLMQRDRDFGAYQDPGALYERRPSILIEPQGSWGRGSIRLIEIPAQLESDDNIVAFWVPETPFKAGGEAEFGYRLRWGNMLPDATADIAYVAETRTGQGGVSGVENAKSLRKFVVDFVGGPLADFGPETVLDPVAVVSGGTLVHSTVSKVEPTGAWRLVLDVDIATGGPVELRAYLVGLGRQLTETWLYQWLA